MNCTTYKQTQSCKINDCCDFDSDCIECNLFSCIKCDTRNDISRGCFSFYKDPSANKCLIEGCDECQYGNRCHECKNTDYNP